MKMTFGNMLAAGRSFFSGERVLAYHERRRAFVPVFNDGKNPFAPKPAAAEPESAPAPAPPAPVMEPRAAAKSLWPAKLNLFRAAEPENVFARPVQPELSLAAVKPVQNDFAESDIERVPAKSRPVPAAGAGDRAWSMLPNAS